MFCYFVLILNFNFDRLSALTPGKIFLLELKESLNGMLHYTFSTEYSLG